MKIRGTEIKVVRGDLCEQEVTAIVNAANNRLIMGGGVAGAIKRKGGNIIQEEADKIGLIAIGEAAVTGAGKLKARYVIHAATMGMDFATDEEKIRLSTRNSLKRAEEKKMESLAFPALGCGVGGFSLEKAARVMSEEVFIHLYHNPTGLKEVRFVLYDQKGFAVFNQTIFESINYLERKFGKYPIPTADIIIEVEGGIVLIERQNPPFGWAIPGGFVEYGESLETTAGREAKEETGLDLEDLRQFHIYSEPGRDPRFHTITTVFIAKGKGNPRAQSDAKNIGIFTEKTLPPNIVFDHPKILKEYFAWRKEHLSFEK